MVILTKIAPLKEKKINFIQGEAQLLPYSKTLRFLAHIFLVRCISLHVHLSFLPHKVMQVRWIGDSNMTHGLYVSHLVFFLPIIM